MPSRPKNNDYPLLEITKEWRQAVEKALDQLGKNRRWLAGEVRCTPSGITNILNGTTEESTYVVPISKTLTIALPAYGSLDVEHAVNDLKRLQKLDPSKFTELCEEIARHVTHLGRGK